MPKLLPYIGNYYLWNYIPSLPAAAIYSALFILATGWVIFRMIRTKTYFSIPFVLGGLFEIIGYIDRIFCRNNTDKLVPYIIQSIVLLVAPALFAASIYMTLGRVIRNVHGEKLSLIPVRWLTKAFVLGDVLSFLVQSGGGGMLANHNVNPKVGENIILVGLFVQIAMFGLFAATAAVFHVRLRKRPTDASLEPDSPWKGIIMMLYAASGLIMVRSIFRVIEYIMGQHGYPLEHEWTLYVFDATFMLATMVVYGIWYPGGLGVKPRTQNWEEIDSNHGSRMATGQQPDAMALGPRPGTGSAFGSGLGYVPGSETSSIRK